MTTLSPLTLLPLPSPEDVRGGVVTLRNAERLRGKLMDPEDVREEGGVRFWRSNNRPVPRSVYREAFVECPAVQAAADEAYLDAFLSDYRKARASGPSDEERCEARAAFGPGVELVDVVTGRRWTT